VTLGSDHLSLRIQICGPLVIERRGQRLEGQLPGRQGRLLFTYLVLQRHRQVDRGELAEALWPGRGAATGEAGLNPLLSKLRRTLGPDAVDGRSLLRLQWPDAWVDLEAAVEAIHRAESSVAQREWSRAWGPAQVALFVAERGFLPTDDRPWINENRVMLADSRLRALECYSAAELGLAGPELAGAVRAARRLVHLAPLRESGQRQLMNALAAQGNCAEALAVYAELCGILREQLGISPSPETTAVYAGLLART
jgi:SARP family transcriptional regulator, regulator of embCAB operon